MFFFKKRKKETKTEPMPGQANISGKNYPAIFRKKDGKEQIWNPKEEKFVNWYPDIASGKDEK